MQLGTSTSAFFDRSATALSTLGAQTEKLQTQISTGKRLQAPSDDSVAYQRLQGLSRGVADDKAWSANITLAQVVLQQSDDALGHIVDQLQHAQELAIQGRNGTLSAGDRKAIADQVRAISADLVSIANSKDVRGQPLFGSATGTTGVTVDAAGNVSFDGTGEPSPVPIADGESVQTNDSARKVLGGLTTASGATDVFAVLKSLADALDTSSTTGVASAVDDLKTSLDQVGGARGSVGARGVRLDLESTRLQEAASTRETDRSSLEDTDTTTAIVELQKATTILQATQASFTKLTGLSLFDYIR